MSKKLPGRIVCAACAGAYERVLARFGTLPGDDNTVIDYGHDSYRRKRTRARVSWAPDGPGGTAYFIADCQCGAHVYRRLDRLDLEGQSTVYV